MTYYPKHSPLIWCFHCDRKGHHQTGTCQKRLLPLLKRSQVFWRNVAIAGALTAAAERPLAPGSHPSKRRSNG